MIWIALENLDATRMLKQHFFIPARRYDSQLGDYRDSNISLCGKIRIIDGDGETETIDHLSGDVFNPDKSCKTCQRIHSKKYN